MTDISHLKSLKVSLIELVHNSVGQKMNQNNKNFMTRVSTNQLWPEW